MALTFVLRSNAAVPTDYAGKPFQDDAQLIPGSVECAYFDLGGEGVAYHDTEGLALKGNIFSFATVHCHPV